MLDRMTWLLVGALMFTACAFHASAPGSASDGDDADDPTMPMDPDAPVTGTTPDSPDDIVNLATADEKLGTADLTLGVTGNAPPITIDTSGPAVDGVTLPAGVDFVIVKRNGTGGELALLRVKDLALQGTIHVIGSRPLVIIANSVQTSAAIDVTAHSSGSPGNPSDDNILTSNRGGAIEIYGKLSIANSTTLVAGTTGRFGSPGAIVLQGGTIDNSSGSLSANGAEAGPNADFGGSGNGRIFLIYKQALMAGRATPKPTLQQYGL